MPSIDLESLIEQFLKDLQLQELDIKKQISERKPVMIHCLMGDIFNALMITHDKDEYYTLRVYKRSVYSNSSVPLDTLKTNLQTWGGEHEVEIKEVLAVVSTFFRNYSLDLADRLRYLGINQEDIKFKNILIDP